MEFNYTVASIQTLEFWNSNNTEFANVLHFIKHLLIQTEKAVVLVISAKYDTFELKLHKNAVGNVLRVVEFAGNGCRFELVSGFALEQL